MRQHFILFFLLIPVFLFSQSFNYQTVIRDSDGQVVKNQQINFEIQILLVDSIVYAEEHSANTGDLGIVNFQIGQGANQSTNFSEIDWSKSQYKLRVKINGEEIGVSDIVAVPFANYAEKSGDNYWNQTDSTKALNYRQGRVGIGVEHPKDPLDVEGLIRVSGSTSNQKLRFYSSASDQDNIISSYDEEGEQMWLIFMGDRSSNDLFRIESPNNGLVEFAITKDGNVGIGTSTPTERLVVNGRTKTKTLEITGGGDGAEHFNSNEKLEPGTLVIAASDDIISASKKAYSKKIIGIVSGAGGISPGITLQQKNVLEGNTLISLWGRVYVKASNLNGNIKAGDLLTSSSQEGRVMKATSRKKSRNAIIGKALTSCSEKNCLIKILIQPQ